VDLEVSLGPTISPSPSKFRPNNKPKPMLAAGKPGRMITTVLFFLLISFCQLS